MNAWLLKGFGGLKDLSLGHVDDIDPGPGEVVLHLRYAALNPADRYLAEGQYPGKPPFPHILGRDGIGTVVEVGDGVTGIKDGDVRVVLRSEIGVMRWGTFAEYVAVPVESLAELPPEWSEQQGAAAPLVYLTAYQALTQWGDTKPGVVL